MLFWTHKPNSICVEECKLLFSILIGQQPITLLVLGQKQGCVVTIEAMLTVLLCFLSENTLFLDLKQGRKWSIPLLFHPCPVNVTPLSRFVHCGRLIITHTGSWGSFGGASVPVMPALKTIYLSRHLHDNEWSGDFWPKDIQQDDDHVMLAESKLMTRRGSWMVNHHQSWVLDDWEVRQGRINW